MSDQIAVMNAGALEQVGTPREIYARPRTRFVRRFPGRDELDRRHRRAARSGKHDVRKAEKLLSPA